MGAGFQTLLAKSLRVVIYFQIEESKDNRGIIHIHCSLSSLKIDTQPF
jgi:hypothetical protein